MEVLVDDILQHKILSLCSGLALHALYQTSKAWQSHVTVYVRWSVRTNARDFRFDGLTVTQPLADVPVVHILVYGASWARSFYRHLSPALWAWLVPTRKAEEWLCW